MVAQRGPTRCETARPLERPDTTIIGTREPVDNRKVGAKAEINPLSQLIPKSSECAPLDGLVFSKQSMIVSTNASTLSFLGDLQPKEASRGEDSPLAFCACV